MGLRPLDIYFNLSVWDRFKSVDVRIVPRTEMVNREGKQDIETMLV